jgi:hypothetical protein
MDIGISLTCFDGKLRGAFMGNIHRIRMIDIALLHGHPLHAGVMPPALRRKLAARIVAIGRYEPVVVRRHPEIAGAYQVVHGHRRVEALRELGYLRIASVVWKLDEVQTLAALACANRHCGKERAARRLALLRSLHGLVGGDIQRMASLLPESAETLRKLFAPAVVAAARPDAGERPVALTLFLPAAERERVCAAMRQADADPGRALLAAAEILPRKAASKWVKMAAPGNGGLDRGQGRLP